MKSYPYEVRQIKKGIYLVNEKLSTMYIIEGTERALVIDCGTGVGDFRGLVENITKLPYDLVATHTHPDHIGGRGQFPHMFITSTDAKKIKSVSLPYRKFFTGITLLSGNKIDIQNITIDKTVKEPEIHIIHEGDKFDLGGGRVAEIFETPGHTNGSVSILLKSDRILFTGDTANPYLFMWMGNSSTITQLVKTLDKIYGIEGYDVFYPSHSMEPLQKDAILKIRQLAMKLKSRRNIPIPLVLMEKDGPFTIIYRASHIHSSSDLL